MREWMTLEEAARHLGLSPRTVRRWIRAGKLRAELRPGPYGQQYLIPVGQLTGIAVVRDLERLEREEAEVALAQVVERHLAQRETEVLAELRRVQADLTAIRAQLDQILAALRAETDRD